MAAAVWHAILVSEATNDNFLHLTLAKQLLGGELPVRDFFDHGWGLQYGLSALAQAAFGEQLLSEAVIVGTMWAISTYLVFGLVRRLTGSTAVAVLSALLLIIAGPRGYAYPKGIVYSAAAVLWWRYVRNATAANAVRLGAWAAVAFYWRPDHGVYVAAGTVLAALAAHGPGWQVLVRSSAAGATALALAAPFLVYVQLTVGLADYVETGVVQAEAEHTTHGTHDLPLLRHGSVVTLEPAADYAPVVAIRWRANSSPESRRAIIARYGLTHVSTEEPGVDLVRLSERSLGSVRQLLNEPLVEDTAGIDRSTATVPAETWPAWQRWSFRYPWLRMRLLPDLDPHARASEILVAVFYLLPLLVLVTAGPWFLRYLPDVVTGPRLAAFACFALIVNVGLLRTPYTARAADAVVLPAVLLGCYVAALWRAAATSRLRRSLLRAGAIVVAALVIASVSAAAQFGERIGVLAGHWRSLRSARAAWNEVHGELTASPPLSYYLDRPTDSSLRLAAYVRDCVPPSERLLVLWFAPEIYYYADRLMAQRHLVFVPAWAALEHEQRMALAKVKRFSPPVALARRSAIDPQARATFPGVLEYVEQEYALAGTIVEEGEEYLILARRDRAPLRRFGDQNWPCYSGPPGPWERVGRPVNDKG